MRSNAVKEAGACVLRNYGEFFKKQYQDFKTFCNDDTWEENKTYTPILVEIIQSELVPITDLVTSDNTLMTKVLSVLSSLCVEVVTLKNEAFEKYFKFLSIHEEYRNSDVASQMKVLCQMTAFVTRCNETLRNLCCQMFAIYTENFVNLNGIKFHYVINHIGEIFTVLVLLELLIANTSLPTKWKDYCDKLQTLSQKPDYAELHEEKYQVIKGALDNITSKLMDDSIVLNSLQQLVTLRKRLVDKNCSMVAAEFALYLKLAVSNLDKLVQDKPNMSTMYKCIKVNCLFVLSSHLFGNMDKKMFKLLIELNMKAHSIFVTGTTIWFPEQFLQRYAQSHCASYGKLSQTMMKTRQVYLNTKKTSLSREMAHQQNVCTQWALTVEETFSASHHKLCASEMSTHAKILLDGLDIASTIHYSTSTLINLHVSLGVPLSKNMLMSLFEAMDMLKCLKNAIMRNYNQIINSLKMITQHLMFQAISSILEVKKSLMNDKNYANKRLDELTCLVIAEKCLRGTATLERVVATNIALNFVPDATYFEDSYLKLGILLEKIQSLINFMKFIDYYCNCSLILWHQHVVSIYFDQNFSVQTNVLKLKYFLMVLEDCMLLLHETDEQYGINKSTEFLNTLKQTIDEKLLHITSQNIETNIRLHIHSHLQLDVVNPFTSNMTKKLLLIIDNFRLQSIYMCVVPTVEHYLSTTYYNLTTVVLSDWKTYGEMRQMAKFKFNLKTVPDNLPTQTLEQGLDILEIMRNIHIFVSKYLYNLNNQIFIEKSSNNKHLNSINIRHIANSIRTHGTGIMNTTVNFTYQFLKKKFFTFSQFMYDEHIKSRLVKDLRAFKEMGDASENAYPYKNADRFNKGIKMLGLAEDGQSYLDLFRDLISEIGNAMGYVRMIRSGGRHCCSDATVFLPSLDTNKSFQELCEDADLRPVTITAAENLDNNIKGLISNFIQGTEYFKLLVDVFAPVFRNPKNVHLKNFFIIVPPLTLNFVEHMILCKDKMSKKNKVGSAFTDDGFAMGVAYILKLLEQDSAFESLHWFDSVWKYISNERKILEEQKNKGSVQLQQALALTEKKLKTLEVEYKLLYYSLTSARIFFR